MAAKSRTIQKVSPAFRGILRGRDGRTECSADPALDCGASQVDHLDMSRLFSGTPFDRPATCETCGKPPADCRCLHLPQKKKMGPRPGVKRDNRLDSGLVLTPQNSRGPADQIARIRTEKRKGNRFVTVVAGLEHPGNDLDLLCGELKKGLGVGGSVQGRTIELQGEHAEAVRDRLLEKGIKARIL
jgi:translation initiation factor 1